MPEMPVTTAWVQSGSRVAVVDALRAHGPVFDPGNERVESLPAAPFCPRRITLRGHVDTLTGYGQILVGLVQRLQERGIPVAVVPMHVWDGEAAWGHELPASVSEVLYRESPDDWEVLFAPPAHSGLPGKRTVHFTMWESNRLPREFVDNLNRQKAVFVPSEWCQTSFDAAGVSVPIHKVPLAVDTDVFKSKKLYAEDFDGPLVLGTGGRTAHGGLRKGIFQVYEAFQIAFPQDEDVRLEIKIFPDCVLPEIQDPRVKVIREAWSDAQMAAWYQGLDAYVSCAAAEGFGLMPLQAMACGVPVFAVAKTGHAEYLDSTVGACCGYSLRQAEQVAPENGYYAGYWYVPDLESVASKMRVAYEDRANDQGLVRRTTGGNARRRAELFSWDVMLDRLIERLQAVGMPL